MIRSSEHWPRTVIALEAVEACGGALMLLPRGVKAEERDDQLKTSADQAAEAWVMAYLKANFPDDRMLAEEEFERRGEPWDAPRAFWTIDALDGTRSFADGFAGFCVQVAYVVDGVPRLGVVHEPALGQTYFAALGAGAYRKTRGEEEVRAVQAMGSWGGPNPPLPRFVDSTQPKQETGPGKWVAAHHATFVELGSIGLKICRIADGSADVFLKHLRFKLWDVAPGEVILGEAGGRLGLWDGSAIPYGGTAVHFQDILATHASRFDGVVAELAAARTRPMNGRGD